ncbi:4771_t:CDS:2, partial [Dentiscutata erythropus]
LLLTMQSELDLLEEEAKLLDKKASLDTSWYKDVKKLEDIVNRDRKKRTLCQDNGIFLLE